MIPDGCKEVYHGKEEGKLKVSPQIENALATATGGIQQ